VLHVRRGIGGVGVDHAGEVDGIGQGYAAQEDMWEDGKRADTEQSTACGAGGNKLAIREHGSLYRYCSGLSILGQMPKISLHVFLAIIVPGVGNGNGVRATIT